MAAAHVFSFPEKGSVVLRQWMQQRTAARRRSFDGAMTTRLTASFGGASQALNADLDSALGVLRARARTLCANHEYGRRFLSMVATNIVGAAGPTLQVRAFDTRAVGRGGEVVLDKAGNAAVERHWWLWSRECDLAGRMGLAQMLRVIVKSVARDGEAVVRKVRGRQFSYGLRLQLLEADRIDETLNQRLGSGNVIRMGVEIDATGRALALWMFTTHPGENVVARGPKWVERVPIEDVYHLFVPERAEQVRGYSWLHAVLLRARMLQGYEEAAITAARVGAAKMGVFKKSLDAAAPGAAYTSNLASVADGQDPVSGKLHITAEPGEFLELPEGYELQSWNPDYPHQNFGDFVKSCLRGMAAGLDVDYPTLANDLEGVNYSSMRGGTIEIREVWMTLQDWLIDTFLLPLYRDWLTIALPMGAVTFNSGAVLPPQRLDKFLGAAEFRGRRWPWVDPLKDAQAVETMIRNKLTSRTRVAAEQGIDFDDIVAELAQEETAIQAAGLAAPPPAPAPAPAPAADPPADAEEEE